MKDLERLLVTLITNVVIKDYDSSNSRSISYNSVRNIAKNNGLFKQRYISNSYLKEMIKKYEGTVFLHMDRFGSDEMFLDEDEEEKFYNGELSEDDGLCLYVFDTDLHSDYECFYNAECKYYEHDELAHIKKFYERKDDFLSNFKMDKMSIESILSSHSLDEEIIQHFYFAMAEEMNQSMVA